MTRKWSCSMIGAREHYALPRALHRIGRLERVYTDAWAGPVLRRCRIGPAAVRGLAARWHPELPASRVVGFTAAGVGLRLRRAARPPRTLEEQYLGFAEEGRAFALRVNRRLERAAAPPAGLIGYGTGCLETQQLLATWGVPTVVDQIDPARVEQEIVRVEAERWPGWQAISGRVPDEYFGRIAEEWELAARIVVNSEWSREALVRQGVPAGKLVVVPLCYDAPPRARPRRPVGGEAEVTVLWLGQVILRKGIQYLLEAARLLAASPVRFVVAGPLGVSAAAVAAAPANVRFVGPVARSRAADLYDSADLFVLPTLSDGFAITQLEAMAHGLPVVATPCCGRVVEDGSNGRIVPPADAEALAAAIEESARDRRRLLEMSRLAVESVSRFSLDRVAERLDRLTTEVATESGAGGT